MKRIFFLLVIVAIAYSCKAQVYVGMRDTRYIYGGFQLKSGFTFGLEHSVYSDNLSYQKVRIYGGYKHQFKKFNLSAYPYASTIWNGQYKDLGIQVKGDYQILDEWNIDATINPHYDSGLHYDTFFNVGTKVKLTNDIKISAHYTTIPVYRESEKALRAGFEFKVGNLQVTPELAMTKIGTSKSMRVLCGMEYWF